MSNLPMVIPQPAKPKDKGGRPSIVDDELRRAKFLEAIALGLYMSEACHYARVSRAAVSRCLAEGRRPGSVKKFRDFLEDYKRARDEALVRAASTVQKCIADGDGKLALKFMQVRYPERWGSSRLKRAGVTVNVGVGVRTGNGAAGSKGSVDLVVRLRKEEKHRAEMREVLQALMSIGDDEGEAEGKTG